MENNIDKLFKNKLLQHQEQPSNEAWKKLEEAMYGKQIKRRSLVAYWQVAAAVALLLTVSFFYLQSSEKNKVSANLKDTQIEQATQQKETILEAQKIEIEEVKTYQPIKYLAKNKTVKTTKIKTEKIKTEVSPMPIENIGVTAQAEEQSIASNEVEKLTEAETTLPQESTEKEIRITVKFADEIAPTQEKKSWLGKVVSNIKKKRQQEYAKENEGSTEKATFSVFGIDTEKVFAKKKVAE